jgi:hypothetical protein
LKNLTFQNQGRGGTTDFEVKKLLIERPVNKLSEDILALERKPYRLVSVHDWPLWMEVAPTYYGLLGKCHIWEIWAGRRILLSCTLSMPSFF